MPSFLAAGVAAALLSSGVAAAPSFVPAADSGSVRCSTGKGVLRATDAWSPNVSKTLHQVFLTRYGSVKGNSHLPYKYELSSVRNSAGAAVSYSNGAWVFQVPRNKKVNVTVTWRAKPPASVGAPWVYASCTMLAG